jgi:hypothetical protein
MQTSYGRVVKDYLLKRFMLSKLDYLQSHVPANFWKAWTHEDARSAVQAIWNIDSLEVEIAKVHPSLVDLVKSLKDSEPVGTIRNQFGMVVRGMEDQAYDIAKSIRSWEKSWSEVTPDQYSKASEELIRKLEDFRSIFIGVPSVSDGGTETRSESDSAGAGPKPHLGDTLDTMLTAIRGSAEARAKYDADKATASGPDVGVADTA